MIFYNVHFSSLTHFQHRCLREAAGEVIQLPHKRTQLLHGQLAPWLSTTTAIPGKVERINPVKVPMLLYDRTCEECRSLADAAHLLYLVCRLPFNNCCATVEHFSASCVTRRSRRNRSLSGNSVASDSARRERKTGRPAEEKRPKLRLCMLCVQREINVNLSTIWL